MQQQPPRQRPGTPQAAVPSPEARGGGDEQTLESMLAALSRGGLKPEAWEQISVAARAEEKLNELALAFDAVARGKRLKATPPAAAAEFLFQAARVFSDVGNERTAVAYLERALALAPGHAPSFAKLAELLRSSRQHRKLAELFAAAAQTRARAEQPALLKQATDLLLAESGPDGRLVELLQQRLRLDPGDEDARSALEPLLLKANRYRDAVRLNEQALSAEPAPDLETQRNLLSRIVELYATRLQEPERALPHVEQLLGIAPAHEQARVVAHRLVAVKGLAARAAAALADAYEALGSPREVAHFLTIELESTRGVKRAPLLARLARLKRQAANDPAGAFECFESALAIDAGDEDLRSEYVALALELGRPTEAARTLTRLLGSIKDPAARARTSMRLAEVVFRSGDVRRASAISAEVLGAQGAPADAALDAAYLLREIRSGDGDPRELCDVLEHIAKLEPSPERRRDADERLANLAVKLDDRERAIGAYERLLATGARPAALEALAALYEATGQRSKHAWLLEERAKQASDPAQGHHLLLCAAELYASGANDAAAAIAACKTAISQFGPARETLAFLVPLLRRQHLWPELAEALSLEIAVTDPSARVPLLSQLGSLRLERLDDAEGAISALEAALSIAPDDAPVRAALEKLAAGGEHRARAARVLEPIYRREGRSLALLGMLEVRASSAPSVEERLAALREAAELSAAGAAAPDEGRRLELLARGLAQAAANEQPIGEWTERLTGDRTDPARLAAILAGVLGHRAVDTDELSALARRAAEAMIAIGSFASAIGFYRRALAYEPDSDDLLAKIDDLLRAHGSPAERVALCRAALEGAPRDRRRELLHRIGDIQRADPGDVGAAIGTFRTLLEQDPSDAAANTALQDLYAAAGQWGPLCHLLENQIGQIAAQDARGLRARLIVVAAEHGDAVRVREHCARLLDDPELEGDQLDAVQTAADRIGAVEIVRAVLKRRADTAVSPRETIGWLDRLGALDLDRLADAEAAATSWKRAARLAESIGDDDAARTLYARARKLTPDDPTVLERLAVLCERSGDWADLVGVYLALEAACENPGERVDFALRAARVLSARLDKPADAARQAARAFELAPERTDVLVALEEHCAAAGTLDALEQSIAGVLERSMQADLVDGGHRSALLLARARAVASDSRRSGEAITRYRSIVEDPLVSAPARADALCALQAFVAAADAAVRREDHEWLLDWSAEHAASDERALRLLAWARVEETTYLDPVRALAIYRRALTIDPESDEALAAIARLSLDDEAAEEALSAMRVRRHRAEGAPRRAMDLQIARTLVRTGRWAEAVESLSSVLAEVPADREALGLAAQALAQPSVRERAIGVVERACDECADGAAREQILEALMGIPLGARDVESRRRWAEKLCDMQRDAGRPAQALATALAAVRQAPEAPGPWDRAESLAPAVDRGVDDVAAVYEEILSGSLSPKAAGRLGERALRFCEEWFDDDARVARILDRILTLDPAAEWAFERLKLVLDSSDRWDDLFALYDRALVSAAGARRATLLEDAAQTAKDFANRPDRATSYLERLREMRPSDAKLSIALERLYERQGRHGDLVSLLGARLPTLDGDEARHARVRIASLWLDELGDPAAALETVEALLGDRAAPADVSASAWSLVERVLASVSERPASDPSTSPPEAWPAAASPPTGEPARSASATVVRRRAAEWLRDHYAETGRDADLAYVLLVELEGVQGADERARLHVRIAELYERVGDLASAVDQTGRAVVLTPEDEALRARMARLSECTGRFESLAEVLAAAADSAREAPLRATLAMKAAEVRAHRLGDGSGAIALLLPILLPAAGGAADDDHVLAAARMVEPLLESAGRFDDELDVLERIAAIERDEHGRQHALGRAARLAARLGQHGRAVASWELRLASDRGDREALDGLVALLGVQGHDGRLARVLELRAAVAASPDLKREDLVRVAALLGGPLGRPHEAVEAWLAIEREFGEADDAVSALADLFRSTDRWAELSRLLERAAKRATDPAARADRLADLGDVLRERLGESGLAVSAYGRALDEQPTSVRARSGLQALANGGPSAAAAVDVLLAILRACDDWEAVLGLSAKRVAAAGSPEDRVGILVESAQLAERRALDARRAFDFVSEALSIAPHDEDIQREIARLAERAGAWPALVDAYRHAVAKLEDRVLAARLWNAIGATLESCVHDFEGALDAYTHVVSLAPDGPAACAAVRAAGRLGFWERGARTVVDAARASSALAAEVLDAFERAALEHGAWDAAAGALTKVASCSELRGLPAREIHARVAQWHRDRRGDPESAEDSLRLALEEDPANVELLASLAASERRRPDRRFVDTLVSLARASGGSLALLKEAASVARDPLGDRPLALRLAQSMLDVARQHPAGPPEGGEEQAPTDFAEWAVETLAQLHDEAGDAASLVDTLAVDDALPLAPEVRASMRRRAARAALDRLGDRRRATALYLSIVEENPRDLEAVERLASIYEKAESRRDLLALRERQIRASLDVGERIPLRLDAARLLVELGDGESAAVMLRDNLGERPWDAPTVERLAAVLESAGRHSELLELLEAHAAHENDAGQSCDLWARAARVAGECLSDDDSAARYHEKVVALEPRADSFAALTAIAERRSAPLLAAGWLERWLDVVSAEEHTQVALRLAEVLVAVGQSARAAQCLERAVSRADDGGRLRERLAALYRGAGRWPDLARVVADAAACCPEGTARLVPLLEAAELFAGRCGDPERAVSLLKEALGIAPQDQQIQLRLADVLSQGGRHDEARALVQAKLDAFGGHRPKPRAAFHHQMARLELRAGRRARALAELDAAARIDPQNPESLRDLARLAHEDGQLERAEKSYRALLTVLRRRREGSEPVIARSEILLELSAIATGRGEPDRAKEILESALEAASDSDAEQAHLERILRARDDCETLARVLEARASRMQPGPQASKVLGELADVFSGRLGRAQDALRIRMQALAADPRSPGVHDAALALCRSTGGLDRYVEDTGRLVDQAIAAADAALASALLLRLGAVIEADLDDAPRALPLYEKALCLDPESRDALAALDRICERLGDGQRRADVLASRVDLEKRSGNARAASDALYRLAALRLASRESPAGGVEHVKAALELDPSPDRVERALGAVAAVASTDPGAVVSLLQSLLECVDDPADRVSLRLERVRAMQRLGAADADLAGALREVLDEQPAHARAARMLTEILERTGPGEELAALLLRQIEAAKDRADSASIASLALRLGSLLEPSDRAGARSAYYTGLDWEPNDPRLLDALLRLLEGGDDEVERADVLERRLALEHGAGAQAMATALWRARSEAGDEAGAERALLLLRRAVGDEPLLDDARSLLEAVEREV